MVTAPAAPTLAELMESLPEINPLNYNDDDVRCLNDWAISVWQAYRSGKLREVGDGEVVVPREPTEAMLAAAEKEWRKGCLNPTIHVWDAMLAAKDAS